VVLAGGLGTRLSGVLPDLPKPMAPVAGRPFVEWVIRYLGQQGIRDVVISTGFRADAFDSHFAGREIPGVESIRCIAEPSPLGTAGGFLHAASASELQPDAWLVLNGDSLLLCPLQPLLVIDAKAGLLARRMEDASRYGSLLLDDEHRLQRFLEKRPGAGLINGGVYLVSSGLLAEFPKKEPLSWEIDVFPTLLDSDATIRAVPVEAPFLDIGLPETLAEAERFVNENQSWFGS
jgi:D-glycero-alpha-D-manno-heptose 1-phosphate guanylyltransferase